MAIAIAISLSGEIFSKEIHTTERLVIRIDAGVEDSDRYVGASGLTMLSADTTYSPSDGVRLNFVKFRKRSRTNELNRDIAWGRSYEARPLLN